VPKILIHAGMPKAGSTALQLRFKASRSALRKRGVLYPGKIQNHNFLIADGASVEELPRIFRQHYKSDEAALRRDFDEFWSQILRQTASASPDVVVMSGESLWTIDKAGAKRLKSRLLEISDDIHIVCYVRKPSDFYLSLAQQKIKASHFLPKAAGIKYKRNLEALQEMGTHLHVHAFARENFVGGDVCLDFAERHLGDRSLLAQDEADGFGNETISAEAMAILQDYRAVAHPENATKFTKDTNSLIRGLRDLAAKDRPKLRPEIRDFIDGSSTDLVWLKDAHGISFSDIDYARIHEADPKMVGEVADICFVDEAKKRALLNLILKRSLQEQAEGEPTFKTVFKSKKAKA
jgi:hypothetical protein